MKDPIRDLVVGNIPGVKDPKEIQCQPDAREKAEIERELNINPFLTPNQVTTKDRHSTEVTTKAAVETRAQLRANAKPFKPLIVTLPDDKVVTPEILRQKQQNDPTLRRIRERMESGEQSQGRGGSIQRLVKEEGIIYREFEAPNVEFGDKFKQVLVPKDYRIQVMKLAHESILGGHQGVKKTCDKILTNFYWPGLGADVHRYCQSCDICQRTISKGRITKVPLGETPLIEAPFERIAVDLVGPIKPVTDRGHRYIIVLVDYATRYPEATPLKSIDTETVAEALLTIYSRLGIPKEVLTDLGTQFVSNLMKEVNRLLSIRNLTTTPYHAMANGLVERYNGTLKQMLKRMCQERPKDWDRYIAPLLFAYRETPQESTGFSPFELLYGRTVRGPMTILKELWTGHGQEPETKTTYQYILDLQQRLEGTCQVAREELKRAKMKQRIQYNRKARHRSFEVGDEVLLLIPTDNNKILMQWKGPFKVKEKLNSMNYRVDFGHRTQTFHANMLKKYHRREDTAALRTQDTTFEFSALCIQESRFELAAAAVIEEDEDSSDQDQPYFGIEDMHIPSMKAKESVKDVHISSSLDEFQKTQVKRILGNFKDTLTDVPGRTNLGKHTIVVTDETPIRRRPYPIPHALREEVQRDIESMLEMGVISKSNSPYAFPLVAIRKGDGTLRSCVDMRLLNQVTVFDAEPVPDQEEIFSKLSEDQYFTKIDLCKEYWQIPMDEASKKYTTFITHNGLYTFNSMPFGLVNAGATFSRVMRTLLSGLKKVDNYIDDILIHTVTWEEHLERLTQVFKRLKQANLTAKPSKCFVACREVEFLGHVVGGGKVRPKPDKIEAISQAKQPETKTQLRSFLGLAGYYRKFIPDFAAIACPLTDGTKKGKPNKIEWGDSQARAFQTLKTKLTRSPILPLPDLKKEFVIRTDASDNGIGAVLMQECMGILFPVYYISKKLKKCERAYSTMEKECLAIVWAVQKLSTYLYGKEFTVQTDHQPLSCIKRSKIANGRIMRWALTLQPYRYRVEVIKGSQNIGADYMSRAIPIAG
ncbi:uncharacterized protein [Amphiura filiformis]|uniref:uncharacterized protein n=1 Tax=Amphiura filiformis TaxID=82378 RepID=UPI003B2181AD